MTYYDRQGKQITHAEWGALFEVGGVFAASREVAETMLPSGRWISTVRLGLDHRIGVGPPLIFETMISDRGEERAIWLDYQERYSTEAQALVGHEAAVAWAIADEQREKGSES